MLNLVLVIATLYILLNSLDFVIWIYGWALFIWLIIQLVS